MFYGPPRRGPGTSDPERITWTAASLLSMLMAAYEVQAFQVAAPDWAATTRFDIVTKVPPGTSKAQVSTMWQSLLRDRLGLAVHRESKEFQVYELTVAKGGPKTKPTDLPPDAEPFDFGAGNPKAGQNGALNINGAGSVVTIFPSPAGITARLSAKGLTMPELAARVGGWASHPIVDRTGLAEDSISFSNLPRICRGLRFRLGLPCLRATARASRAPMQPRPSKSSLA